MTSHAGVPLTTYLNNDAVLGTLELHHYERLTVALLVEVGEVLLVEAHWWPELDVSHVLSIGGILYENYNKVGQYNRMAFEIR